LVLFFGTVATELVLTPSATANDLVPAPGISTTSDVAVWDKMPFTAREWARQTLLPYRDVPLKSGGHMSVQEAYDLYLQAGQPVYPDMSTPGLVTPEEVSEQIRISKFYNPARS
jgi:hypothetical protein